MIELRELEVEFDVRKELVERPDEWVGAFRNESGDWFAVCRSSVDDVVYAMRYGLCAYKSWEIGFKLYTLHSVTEDELDRCIRYDDVKWIKFKG